MANSMLQRDAGDNANTPPAPTTDMQKVQQNITIRSGANNRMCLLEATNRGMIDMPFLQRAFQNHY